MFELIFNVGVAIVLLFFLIVGLQIPELSNVNDFVEAKGFPVIFSIIAMVLLAVDVISLFRKLSAEKKDGKDQAPGEFDMAKFPKILIILGMTVLYIVSVNTLGFVLLSVLFAFLSLNLLGSKRQVFNVIFSVLTVLVLTLIFGRFFAIALPRGVGILRALSFYLY